MDEPISSKIETISYAVSFASAVTGVLALHFSPRAALLPAAFVFGWCQIGGL